MVEPAVAAGDALSPCLAGLREAGPELCIVVVVREVDAPLARALIRYSVNGVIPLAARSGEAVCILRQVIDGNASGRNLAVFSSSASSSPGQAAAQNPASPSNRVSASATKTSRRPTRIREGRCRPNS